MKKCSATVICNDNIVKALQVRTVKGDYITFNCFNELPFKSHSLLIYNIKEMLKNNNLYMDFYEYFGRRWYDIVFIENNTFNRYSC